MNRDESLRHFKEKTVDPLTNEMLFSLEEYYQEHKQWLAQEFLSSLQRITNYIIRMQQQGDKSPIGYLTYSMLRTELSNGKPTYLMDAMDKSWFMDTCECRDTYNAGWAFQFLDEWEIQLNATAKSYMGRIGPSDIHILKLSTATKLHQYVIALARYSLAEGMADRECLFDELQLEEEFEIRIGEYLDVSETIYKRDIRMKESEKVKEFLEDKNEFDYVGEVFRHLNMPDGHYEGIHLRYADLSGSNVAKSMFTAGILIGSRWEKANCQEADFSRCLIQEARFQGADLRDACFAGSLGSYGMYRQDSWERPGFEKVSFAGANLEGADFTDALLSGADFREANLERAIFKGALLDGTMFSPGMEELLGIQAFQKE